MRKIIVYKIFGVSRFFEDLKKLKKKLKQNIFHILIKCEKSLIKTHRPSNPPHPIIFYSSPSKFIKVKNQNTLTFSYLLLYDRYIRYGHFVDIWGYYFTKWKKGGQFVYQTFKIEENKMPLFCTIFLWPFCKMTDKFATIIIIKISISLP